VDVLWVCCGCAVGVLRVCCGCAVGVLWVCCGCAASAAWCSKLNTRFSINIITFILQRLDRAVFIVKGLNYTRASFAVG
jgi:hypothetical protein